MRCVLGEAFRDGRVEDEPACDTDDRDGFERQGIKPPTDREGEEGEECTRSGQVGAPSDMVEPREAMREAILFGEAARAMPQHRQLVEGPVARLGRDHIGNAVDER